MNWLANYVFKIGYAPIQYQSVKGDFLSWYYEAVSQNSLSDEIDLSDSELVERAIEAGEAAKKLDENHRVIEVIDNIEEYISRLKIALAYVAAIFFAIGMGSLASTVFLFDTILFIYLFGFLGMIIGVPPIFFVVTYIILVHNIRANSQLVAKFNSELVVSPAHSNQNIRHRNQVTAEYLWNRSLMRPQTIIVLILLGVTKLVRPRLYGIISTELREQVGEFVEGGAKEILKTELRRLKDGKFGMQN